MRRLHIMPTRKSIGWIACLGSLLAGVAVPGYPASVRAQQNSIKTLRIGDSGSLTSDTADQQKDKAALATLKDFIKEETGFNNEIVPLKSWRVLVDQMAKGQLQLGVFQGYEFAWARHQDRKLKPLALAVNVYVYPTAYIVVKKDNPAKAFADLKGQTLAIPATGQRFLHLFVAKESESTGKSLETFFSKIKSGDNIEDALDDVVDGKVQAVVADRAALESYKSRKPGRFKLLKEIAHSRPFPPPLVAYYDKVLDDVTLLAFENGLLEAQKKDRGQTMLTLFKLTGFEKAPADFGKILDQTLKDYPPPDVKAK